MTFKWSEHAECLAAKPPGDLPRGTGPCAEDRAAMITEGERLQWWARSWKRAAYGQRNNERGTPWACCVDLEAENERLKHENAQWQQTYSEWGEEKQIQFNRANQLEAENARLREELDGLRAAVAPGSPVMPMDEWKASVAEANRLREALEEIAQAGREDIDPNWPVLRVRRMQQYAEAALSGGVKP